MKSKTKVSWTR